MLGYICTHNPWRRINIQCSHIAIRLSWDTRRACFIWIRTDHITIPMGITFRVSLNHMQSVYLFYPVHRFWRVTLHSGDYRGPYEMGSRPVEKVRPFLVSDIFVWACLRNVSCMPCDDFLSPSRVWHMSWMPIIWCIKSLSVMCLIDIWYLAYHPTYDLSNRNMALPN